MTGGKKREEPEPVPEGEPIPWDGVSFAAPVQVKYALVRCGICGVAFRISIIPPQTVQVDPVTAAGVLSTPGTRALPQHVAEPGWRCGGSGVAYAVIGEAGSTWP